MRKRKSSQLSQIPQGGLVLSLTWIWIVRASAQPKKRFHSFTVVFVFFFTPPGSGNEGNSDSDFEDSEINESENGKVVRKNKKFHCPKCQRKFYYATSFNKHTLLCDEEERKKNANKTGCPIELRFLDKTRKPCCPSIKHQRTVGSTVCPRPPPSFPLLTKQFFVCVFSLRLRFLVCFVS